MGRVRQPLLLLLCLMVILLTYCDGKNIIYARLPQTALGTAPQYCEMLDSGPHLTSALTCLTLARESLVGYIERVVGADSVPRCLQCGILPVGVLTANTPGKEVWMDEGLRLAQELPFTVANGSVLEGTNLRATMGLGCKVQHPQYGPPYLETSGSATGCITADSSMILKDFKAITFGFFVAIRQLAEADLFYLLAMATTINSSQFTIKVRYNTTSFILDTMVTYQGNKWQVESHNRDVLNSIASFLGISWSPADGLTVYSTLIKQGEDNAPTPFVEVTRAPTFIIGCDFDGNFPVAAHLADLTVWDNVRDEAYWDELLSAALLAQSGP